MVEVVKNLENSINQIVDNVERSSEDELSEKMNSSK